MFVLINKQFRPNDSIKFYFETETLDSEYHKHFYKKFIVSGKFLNITREIKDNVLTTKIFWKSHSAVLEYMTDEVCYEQEMLINEYNSSNGITVEVSIEENVE